MESGLNWSDSVSRRAEPMLSPVIDLVNPFKPQVHSVGPGSLIQSQHLVSAFSRPFYLSILSQHSVVHSVSAFSLPIQSKTTDSVREKPFSC